MYSSGRCKTNFTIRFCVCFANKQKIAEAVMLLALSQVYVWGCPLTRALRRIINH